MLKIKFSIENIYFLFFFLFLTMYSFNKISTLTSGIKIYYFFIPILYIVYFVRSKLIISSSIKILLLFMSLQFLSLINTFIYHPSVLENVLFNLIRETVIILLLIPLYSFYLKKEKLFNTLLLFIALEVALSNLIYYIYFYDFAGRFQGMFGGSNEFAYMMVLLIYIIYYNFYKYPKLKLKFIWIIILLILHAMVIVTLSRTAILGLIIFYIFSFPYFHTKFKYWQKVLILIIMGLIIIYTYDFFSKTFELLIDRFTNSEGSNSLGSRMWEILAAINMIEENPFSIILGNGTSITSSPIFLKYYSGLTGGLGTRVHNSYFALIVENGIVSFSLFLFFIFHILKKIYFLNDPFKYVILGFFIFTISFLGTIYLFYFLPFWFALFLIVAHIKFLNKNNLKRKKYVK